MAIVSQGKKMRGWKCETNRKPRYHAQGRVSSSLNGGRKRKKKKEKNFQPFLPCAPTMESTSSLVKVFFYYFILFFKYSEMFKILFLFILIK